MRLHASTSTRRDPFATLRSEGPSPEKPKPEGPRLIIPRELLAFHRQCPRGRVPGNPPNGSDACSTVHPKAPDGLKLWYCN